MSTLSKTRISMWIAISALGASAAYLPIRAFFRTILPDCAPQQVDGQCGMATGFADLFSRIVSVLVAIVIAFIGMRRTDQ